MNTAEILRAAAQRVRHGWCQDGVSDGRGGVCAIGAIRFVIGSNLIAPNLSLYDKHEFLARKAIAQALGINPKAGIPDWNDAEDQTAENVANGLEYSALFWEQGQAKNAEQPTLVEVRK